jgi:uncharacterized membrane protein
MSQVVAITFDDEEQAGRALQSLRQLEQQGRLKLDDTAVVVKGKDGSVRTPNEVSGAPDAGAVLEGVIGALVAFLFPVAGAGSGVGLLGTASAGVLLNEGVDKDFVREVQAALRPGSSELFVVAREANVEALVAGLAPFRGTLRQTNLRTDVEESLRRALQ